MKKYISSIPIVTYFINATSVLAQSNVVGGLANSPGSSLTIQGVYDIFLNLACWLAQISIVVMVIAIILYGLMFMWARGNPQAFGAAKTAFGWGIVGALVILGTYTIIATVYVFVADVGGAGAQADPSIILSPFSGCN